MKKVNRKKSAVSTFLAVLILMILAVAAGVVFWAYTMGYVGNFPGTLDGGNRALKVESVAQVDNGDVWIYVKNTGKGFVKLDPDTHARLYVNDVDTDYTLDPGEGNEGLTEGKICTVVIANSALNADWAGKTVDIKVLADDGTFVKAFFKLASVISPSYSLTITVNPPSGGTVTRDDYGPYELNDIVILTESPDSGYTFSVWSGDGTGTGTTRTVIITGNMAVTAAFTQDTYTVTLNQVGQGTPTMTPSGPYTYGTTVNLDAEPIAGWVFQDWTSSTPDIVIASPLSQSTTATINGAGTITVTFTQSQYTLSVTLNPPEGGTVTPNISPPYHLNDEVVLTESPAIGYTFSEWLGHGTGSGTTRTVTITGNMAVTATFTQNEYTLNINVAPDQSWGTVTKDPDKTTYHLGDTVQLTANPATGYTFSIWSGDLTGTTSPATLTIDEDPEVTATFAVVYTQYQVTFDYTVNGGGSPTAPTVNYVSSGESQTVTAGSTATVMVDAGSSYSYTPNPLGGSGATERWQAETTPSGTITAAGTIDPAYYHQYQIILKYSVLGTPAGSPTDPTTTYTKFGASTQVAVPSGSTGVSDWVDAGSSVTYTNPIIGVAGERWKISPEGSASPFTAIASVSSSTTVKPDYFHQYMMTLSYSILPSGSATAPSFTANRFGASTPQTLTTIATGYWFDAGASWGVTNPLSGSGASERWQTLMAVSGTVTSAATSAMPYYHQYLVTVTATPSGAIGGMMDVQRRAFGVSSTALVRITIYTEFVDAGSTVTVINPQSSVGSYTFSSYTNNGATMNSAQTITLVYVILSPPTYVSAGTGSGLIIGNPTPGYPTGLQANDLILLQVVVRGDSTPTITPPTGFVLLYGPDATQGGNSRVTQWIYYKFSTGTEPGTGTVTVTDTDFDRAARMYAFRNVALTSFTEGASYGYGDDDWILAQSVTTSGNNRLAVSFVAVENNISLDSFTGESNGNWAEAVSEFTFDGDDDICMQLQTATMTTTGTISGGSDDTGNTDYRWVVRAFALKP